VSSKHAAKKHKTSAELSCGGALAVGQELVDGGDETFDVGFGYEGDGAGGERFAPVNLLGVARVEDARH
jgi:hypothetical protein